MPTLAEALTTFLRIERASSSRRTYRRILENLAHEIGPGRNLRRITYADLDDYLATYRKEHPIKPSTAHTYSVVIQTFFNWCVGQQLLKRSPAADLHVRVPASAPSDLAAVPYDDLQRMVDYCRYHPRNRAILLFLADTGCRVGALASLTIPHLDVAAGEALVLEKGARWVYVYFADETAEALTAWLNVRAKVRHDLVITTTGAAGKPIDAQGIGQIVRNIARKAGCREVWSAHDIRRRVGEAYGDLEVSLHLTSQKLNHQDTGTTAKFYASRGRKRLNALSRRYALAALQPTFRPEQDAESTTKIIRFPRLG